MHYLKSFGLSACLVLTAAAFSTTAAAEQRTTTGIRAEATQQTRVNSVQTQQIEQAPAVQSGARSTPGTNVTPVTRKPNIDQYGECVFRCLRSPGGTPDKCAQGCAYLL